VTYLSDYAEAVNCKNISTVENSI